MLFRSQTIIAFINQIVAEAGKPKHEYTSCAIPAEMFEEMKKIVDPLEMEEAVFTDLKQVREENIHKITEKLTEAFAENEEWLAVLDEAIYQYQKKTVRKMILKDHKRPDGRALGIGGGEDAAQLVIINLQKIAVRAGAYVVAAVEVIGKIEEIGRAHV